MNDALQILKENDASYYLGSYSALNLYFGKKKQFSSYNTYIVTEIPLFELARYFEDLEYPGLPLIDASLTRGEKRFLFRCIDKQVNPLKGPFAVLEFLFNPYTNTFFDPNGIYYSLREKKLKIESNNFPRWVTLFEAAKLISNYHYEILDTAPYRINLEIPPLECQRELLIGILSGEHPQKGLKLLLDSGFIELCWPEIFSMTKTKHSKDFHPEGNVWEHSLEVLKYRKQFDLGLSLALFLHDIGKPFSISKGEKKFYLHSNTGAKIAREFLTRLKFSPALIERVTFLIKYHMLPHALSKIPIYRTEKIMDSPLFPLLLEIYRADLASTYNSVTGYYNACRIYQNYMREKSNPFKNIKHRFSTSPG